MLLSILSFTVKKILVQEILWWGKGAEEAERDKKLKLEKIGKGESRQ